MLRLLGLIKFHPCVAERIEGKKGTTKLQVVVASLCNNIGEIEARVLFDVSDVEFANVVSESATSTRLVA